VIRDLSWQDEALCQQIGLEVFFPRTDNSPEHFKQAKEICQRCPVIAECLDFGLDEPFGVFGGTSPYDRRRIRLRQAQRRLSA